MSTLDIQMSNQHNGATRPPATLEFRQAMKDFKTMFPTLDMELIECVLRSNSGHVDATVDQLLQLSKNSNRQSSSSRRQHRYHGRHITVDYDSTDSEDSFHSEFLDVATSSDDDIRLRDPPPMYTPHAGDPVDLFPAPSYPAETYAVNQQKGTGNRKLTNGQKQVKKKYKAWNPPMLGTLPDDFLRILPQQFADHPNENPRLQKTSSHPPRHQFVSKPALKNLVATTDPTTISQAFGISTTPSERTGPLPGITGPAIDDGFGNGTNGNFDAMNPPPRPPRTVPVQHSKRRTQRNVGHGVDHPEHVNSHIRTGSDSSRHHFDSSHSSHRSRHHHSRSSRQNHSSRNHGSQPHRCNSNCIHTRKSNDFTSRRMVMVSRLSEPALPISRSDMPNGIDGNHSPSNNIRSNRSSRNPSNHSSAHNRPSSRNDLQWLPPQNRSSHRVSSTNSPRARPRTSVEEEQYVEDCRLAILLQNEEFIRELKRNDEFLKELEKDRPNATQSTKESGEQGIIVAPDPDAKYPHGSRNGNAAIKDQEDLEKDDKAFKENLKHMGKSARKKFNEVAKKFSVRRKSSYKSMKNIDPVFADCNDDFEQRRASSPTFNLNE